MQPFNSFSIGPTIGSSQYRPKAFGFPIQSCSAFSNIPFDWALMTMLSISGFAASSSRALLCAALFMEPFSSTASSVRDVRASPLLPLLVVKVDDAADAGPPFQAFANTSADDFLLELIISTSTARCRIPSCWYRPAPLDDDRPPSSLEGKTSTFPLLNPLGSSLFALSFLSPSDLMLLNISLR